MSDQKKGGWLRKKLVRKIAEAVNEYERELNRPAESEKKRPPESKTPPPAPQERPPEDEA